MEMDIKKLILVFLLIASVGFTGGKMEKPINIQTSSAYMAIVEKGALASSIYFFDKYSIDKRIYTFYAKDNSVIAVIDVGNDWTIIIERNPYKRDE
jgi:hypothetical protein